MDREVGFVAGPASGGSFFGVRRATNAITPRSSRPIPPAETMIQGQRGRRAAADFFRTDRTGAGGGMIGADTGNFDSAPVLTAPAAPGAGAPLSVTEGA